MFAEENKWENSVLPPSSIKHKSIRVDIESTFSHYQFYLSMLMVTRDTNPVAFGCESETVFQSW